MTRSRFPGVPVTLSSEPAGRTAAVAARKSSAVARRIAAEERLNIIVLQRFGVGNRIEDLPVQSIGHARRVLHLIHPTARSILFRIHRNRPDFAASD
jgi:hypothetical protein